MNDNKSMKIMDIINRDEIKHIKFGKEWFEFICQQNNIDKIERF